MDTPALMHPVGPLPPRVYWARRIGLLAVALLVVAVIAVSCAGGSSPARPAGTPTASPIPTSSASVSPARTVAACTNAELSITASTDATTYAAGVLPHLTVAIRNAGAAACRFADTAATRAWSIFSGPDQVWSNAGCSTSAPVITRTLAPSGVVRHGLVWDRHRSGPHCTTSDATADRGTYRLYVTVRGERSAAAIFHLTG
jgi:hypothetical protein